MTIIINDPRTSKDYMLTAMNLRETVFREMQINKIRSNVNTKKLILASNTLYKIIQRKEKEIIKSHEENCLNVDALIDMAINAGQFKMLAAIHRIKVEVKEGSGRGEEEDK